MKIKLNKTLFLFLAILLTLTVFTACTPTSSDGNMDHENGGMEEMDHEEGDMEEMDHDMEEMDHEDGDMNHDHEGYKAS